MAYLFLVIQMKYSEITVNETDLNFTVSYNNIWLYMPLVISFYV
jgi:hypothetical protein